MTRSYIPQALRDRVAAQARHRCGYCLTDERIFGTPMEIDHIIPESLGGQTEEDNLWLACSLCNDHKGDRIAAIDPLTGETVRLFDPRRQVWREHFAWTTTGDRIVGLTPAARDSGSIEPQSSIVGQSTASMGFSEMASSPRVSHDLWSNQHERVRRLRQHL